MIVGSGHEPLARAALSFLAEPGDLALGGLLRCCSPAEIVAAVSSPADSQVVLPAASRDIPGIGRAFERWRGRASQIPSQARVTAWEQGDIRLVCPGETEWPTQLDDLGDARPIVLWVRGKADLRYACLRSVSVVGSRAATAYGSHVCTEMAAGLAERGWSIISGGA